MKIKHLIYGTVLSIALTSCNDRLDLLPEQDIAEDIVFNSLSTAEGALLGIYSTAQLYAFYGSLPQVINDYMGETVNFVGTFPTLQDLNDFSANATNVSTQEIWQRHYEVILRANKVIHNIETVPGVTQDIIDQYTGEAKFLRALAHFQLVNLFAQPYQVNSGTNLGIPLVLEQFQGEINYPSRATLNEVHEAVEKDLLDAVNLLPNNYASAAETRGRATKGAAYALLSRLYLYRDQNDKAIDAVDNALATGNYTLATDYSFYNQNSAEDVFTIQNSEIDNGRTGSGGWASYYQPTALGGRGDAVFSQTLINAYESEQGDKRYELKLQGVAADGLSHWFPTKFPDAVNNSDNAPVLRTTELYLNKAEALAKSATGIDPTAVLILNNLRDRADLGALVPLSKEALVSAILLERTKELAFEGHSRMDLLRNRKNLRANNAKAAFGADNTILPIPNREIDNNPNLRGQQNPGY